MNANEIPMGKADRAEADRAAEAMMTAALHGGDDLFTVWCTYMGETDNPATFSYAVAEGLAGLASVLAIRVAHGSQDLALEAWRATLVAREAARQRGEGD